MPMTHFYAFTGNPVAERHGPARFRGPRRKTVACVEVRTVNRRPAAGGREGRNPPRPSRGFPGGPRRSAAGGGNVSVRSPGRPAGSAMTGRSGTFPDRAASRPGSPVVRGHPIRTGAIPRPATRGKGNPGVSGQAYRGSTAKAP